MTEGTMPTARMCAHMMEKPYSGSFLMLPGALFVVLGVLIFIEPRIMVWLVGGVFILIGMMFFAMARFKGKLHQPSAAERART